MQRNNQGASYRLYLGIGANIDDPLFNLKQAVHAIQKISGIQVESISSIWKTAPVGFVNQPFFLNAAISVLSTISLENVHAKTAAIEELLGRKRTFVHGPRQIDIDLLYAENYFISIPHLIVPHPRMWDRLFVLLPLQEIIPTTAPFLLARIAHQGVALDSSSNPQEYYQSIQREDFEGEDETTDCLNYLRGCEKYGLDEIDLFDRIDELQKTTLQEASLLMHRKTRWWQEANW